MPSSWETEGFGTYDYNSTGSEYGEYRFDFTVPNDWTASRKKVYLVFEGVMRETTVAVNGRSAGPTFQGSFYRFEYGVSFNYPEANVTGMRWLGKGPYRVWKNRRAGQTLGVWSKDYNTVATGAEWDYPEFKGYHADLYWAQIRTTEPPMTVVTDTEDLYLRMCTPEYAGGNGGTDPVFPAGNISFLHGINAIGTKFRNPEGLSPSAELNKADGVYEAKLYFHFGEL